MPVTYPVIEQIAQAIVTRLEAITVANTYQLDVADVMRPTRVGNVGELGYEPVDRLIVVEQGNRVLVEETDGVPNKRSYKQTFLVSAYRVSSKDETVPIDQKVNVIEADAIKALTLGLTPTANWQYFWNVGNTVNLAIGAELGPSDYFSIIDKQVSGVTIPFDVTYRTPVNDPYALG